MNFGSFNKLKVSLERVRRNHPNRLEDFSNPDALADTDIGRRLKRKVLTWGTPPYFGPLLESMDAIELRLLPTYLRDKDRKLAIRVAQCVASKPEISKLEHLLPFLQRKSDQEILPFLLTALGKNPEHFGLSPELTSFVRDWRFDDLGGAIKSAWRKTERTDPYEVAQEIGIDPDSNLGQTIREGFLNHAPVTKWIQAGPAAFLGAFEAAEQGLKNDTLIRLWTGWRTDSLTSLRRQPFAKAVGEHLVENRRSIDLLRRENQEAYEFYVNWLKTLELDTFFDAFPDSERFAFWESYLPRIRAVRGDREFGRLFLDFGNFGVIEFAEIGNAAYVYPPEHFEYYLELNFRRRDKDPGVVKSTDRAMFKLNHSYNWRSRFREKLRDYL